MAAEMGLLDEVSHKKVMMETSEKYLVRVMLGTSYVKQWLPPVFLLSTILALKF